MNDHWPSLRYADWADTCETLRLWTQVAGKIRMAASPMINHWWHVPLYVNARGMTTSPIPDRDRAFEISFDFIDHELTIATTDGKTDRFELEPMTVRAFYEHVMAALSELGIDVLIYSTPSEVPDPIPFEKDESHRSYDAAAVERFWQVLVQANSVFTEFRAGFIGKVSPVHFFWGSFDLAVTRFSGREAPLHPGGPGLPLAVTREAYSHEVSSAGFWPGNPDVDAAFYAYAYPEPDGYRDAKVRPQEGAYSDALREFLLPYDDVRTSKDPRRALLEFLQSTHDAAAKLASWDPKPERSRVP